MIDLKGKVSQADFGALVGISQPAVSGLITSGVLGRDDSGSEWLLSYCANLRERAAGRAAAGDLDLAGERARLAKEQADRVAMQNAVTRKELAPVHLIEEVLTRCGARCAAIFDAIPGAVRRRVPSLSADAIRLIQTEIARARNMAAAVSLEDLRDEDPDDGADVDEPSHELEVGD